MVFNDREMKKGNAMSQILETNTDLGHCWSVRLWKGVQFAKGVNVTFILKIVQFELEQRVQFRTAVQNNTTKLIFA